VSLGLPTIYELNALPVLAQGTNKSMGQKPQTKQTKTASEVKYKAHCGMIYSAADAKKYHYICPMDHKPLTKIVSAKAAPKKGAKTGSMSGMKM
jgi:hypothetical protein